MTEQEFNEFYESRRAALIRLLLIKLGNQDEAQEIAQEAFNQLYNMLNQGEVQYPNALLVKVAKNLAIDRIRQNISRRKREQSWSDHQQLNNAGNSGPGGYPEAPQHRQLEARAELARVLEALDQLGPSVRQAFVLYRFKELTHREVADKLGLSRSTVEKHIIKATRRIMQHCCASVAGDQISGDQAMASTNKVIKNTIMQEQKE